MRRLTFISIALLAALVSPVYAQTAGTVTFSAQQTSATGSLTPVLTWSTTPTASGCTAGGAWSGTKFASGSETVTTITSSKSYTLTCSWGNGSTTVTWKAPTTNTDGTALTNLASYTVLFGTSSSALSQSKTVSDPSATSTTIAALASGTWYFAVRAVNSGGVESESSAIASKTLTSASASKTINITITAPSQPPPSSGNEAEPNGSTSQAQLVGSAGTAINGTMSATWDEDFYRVNLPAGKKLTSTMAPNTSSDYELYLFDSNGNAIGWSENGKGVAENINVSNTGTATRTYYLRVSYYAGGTGATSGRYSIRFVW